MADTTSAVLAMREAAIACVREQAPPRDVHTVVTETQVSVLNRAIAAIRALPAPEVPSEVREWIRIHMDTLNGDSLHARLERFVRDWIRKEWGL